MASNGKGGKANNEGDGRHGKPVSAPAPVHAAHGSKGNEGKHYGG